MKKLIIAVAALAVTLGVAAAAQKFIKTGTTEKTVTKKSCSACAD